MKIKIGKEVRYDSDLFVNGDRICVFGIVIGPAAIPTFTQIRVTGHNHPDGDKFLAIGDSIGYRTESLTVKPTY